RELEVTPERVVELAGIETLWLLEAETRRQLPAEGGDGGHRVGGGDEVRGGRVAGDRLDDLVPQLDRQEHALARRLLERLRRVLLHRGSVVRPRLVLRRREVAGRDLAGELALRATSG